MRQWRVGTFSMGILLVFLGVLLLGNAIWDIPIAEILSYGWSIILIMVGVEVLLFAFLKKEGKLKFDFVSIFLLFIALTFTFIVFSVQETGIFSAIRGSIYDEGYKFEINKELNIPESVSEIEIEAPNGDFKIEGKDTNSAKINGTITINASSEQEAKKEFDRVFSATITGSKAVIKVEETNHKWINNLNVKADLVISIPKNLEVRTKLINGDTRISGINNSGTIDGVNGRINLENSSGNFEVKTVNGEIDINNIDGSLESSTVNGEISVKDVKKEIKVTTTNGEIDVSSKKVEGNIELKTVNGEINLDIPEDANVKIYAKSAIGDVDGNIKWDKVEEDKKLGDEKETTLGTGEYEIELRSTHGEIEVNVK